MTKEKNSDIEVEALVGLIFDNWLITRGYKSSQYQQILPHLQSQFYAGE